MSIHGLGDECLARQYGPHRLALWFDEEPDYRRNNERFWRVRRTLIKSSIWDDYAFDALPLAPEWFGTLMPHRLAYEESGYAWIWCVMLGFPTPAIREEALDLIISDSPSGLVKQEIDPPDPQEYTLPVVGFVTKNAYLTLEPGHPRRYDSWRGYETIGLEDDDEAGLLEVMEVTLAERMLLRRLVLNVGRSFEVLPDGSDPEALVDHARELWAMGTFAAAGAVAGTAMERILAEYLPLSERPNGRYTLGPLIDKVIKHYSIEKEQGELLHRFRDLRNTCAHALSNEGERVAFDLEQAVDEWLQWLESADFESGDSAGPPKVVVLPERPEPATLHNAADSAGLAAAESCVPEPMRLIGPVGTEVVPEGVCGDAKIYISPRSDPLAQWLISEGKASEEGERASLWIGLRTVHSQSMERAVAYARAYIEVLHSYGIAADYQTHID